MHVLTGDGGREYSRRLDNNGSSVGEGQRTISAWLWVATRGMKGGTKATASSGVLYIFQLAAINGLRGLKDESKISSACHLWERVAGPFDLHGNRCYRQPRVSGTSVDNTACC